MSNREPSDAELEAEIAAWMDAFVAEELEREHRIDEAKLVYAGGNDLLARLLAVMAENQTWREVYPALPSDLAEELLGFCVARARMPTSWRVH